MLGKRLQIALEFMIIFAFVLVVFLFLFALVASQRAQTSSSQIYSQEQLIAQSVATQIDTALRSGNGYSARVPITGAIGTLAYQLLITRNGGVIVNATVGNQALQAFAFSTARNVLSSSSYIQTNTFYYNLPIANGTVYIQNSFGTICVDYTCPNASTQAANVSLSSQVVHSLAFDGGVTSGGVTEAVLTTAPGTLIGNGDFSISVWVNAKNPTTLQWIGGLVTNWNGPHPIQGYFTGVNGAGNPYMSVYSGIVGDPANTVTATQNIKGNGWYNVVFVRKASSTLYVYVDGVQTSANDGSPSNLYVNGNGNAANVQLGDVSGSILNGNLANVQLYTAALSAVQAKALYQAGIGGGPFTANLVAWWPLNGNANDYSGNGYGGTISGLPSIFQAVAELFAKVTNLQGYAIANNLVGFSTTFGVFNGNVIPANQVYTNYTNSNGIATAFLNQQGNNGQAVVRATAYNGNTALTSNLVGWWPLNEGQGNTTFDASGNGNSGSMKGGTGWSNPNYVAVFDGNTSYIAPANTPLLQPGSITYSAWIYPTYAPPGSSACPRVIQDGSDGGGGWEIDFDCLGNSAASTVATCAAHTANGWSSDANSPSLQLNNWYMVTCQYSSATGVVSTYLNGLLVGANTIGGGAITYGNAAVPYIGADDAKRAQQFFYGRIANAQVYNSLLSAAQIGQLYQEGIGGEPVTPTGLVDWWPLNGNANDYSGTGNNGTIYGKLSFASSPISMGNNVTGVLAASFNGINSYISTTTSSLLRPTKMTVSAWFDTQAIAYQTIVGDFPYCSSGAQGDGWRLNLRSNGNIWFSMGYWGSDSGDSVWTGAYSTNTLYHLVGVLNGTKTSLYLNGVMVANGITSVATNTVEPVTIGASVGCNGAFGEPFSGNIFNVQVYNVSLSASQISALYSEGGAEVPTAGQKVVGWWLLNGNANDYSGHGNNGTASNVIYVPQRIVLPALSNPFAGSGANFNGQSSYVQLSQQPSWSSAITVSAWANTYSPPTTGVYREIFNNNQFFMRLGGDASDNSYDCFIKLSDGSVEPRAQSRFQPIQNSWNMVTCTWDGTKLSIYVNGALKATSTRSGTLIATTAGPYIGASEQQNPPTSNLWNGSLSDLQIYKTALTANQVLQLYNSQAPSSASAVIPLSWYP